MFLISRYGKQVILKVLTNFKGTDSEDLILNNVAVIKGFHINIVLRLIL